MKDKPKARVSHGKMEKTTQKLSVYTYIYIISHDILVYPHFIIISTIKQWDASYGSG